MLSNSIKNLLKTHGRIIVPDLGAFIYKGGPFPTIYFNEFLRYDDGILVEYLVETDKIDKNAATDKVKVFVDNISKQLSASKPVELEGLGTLFKDNNDKIQLKTGNMKVNNFETPVQVEKDPEPREVYFEIEKTDVTPPVEEKKPVSEPVVQTKAEAPLTEKAQTVTPPPIPEMSVPQTQVKTPVAKTTTEVQQQQQQQQANQPYRTPPPKTPVVQEMPRKKSSKGWIFILFLLIAGAGVYFGYYNPVWKKYFGKAPFAPNDSISAPTKKAPPESQEATVEPEKAKEPQAESLHDKQTSQTKTPVAKQVPSREVKKSTASAGSKKYRLIAGSFSVEANADKMVQKLKSEGFNAEKFVTSKSNFFYVSYGSYDDRAEAAQEMNRIKAGGKENVWILNY